MTDTYIIGTLPIPLWCESDLQPYLRADGTVGYEYQGYRRSYDLVKGDKLLNCDGWIYVRRQ